MLPWLSLRGSLAVLEGQRQVDTGCQTHPDPQSARELSPWPQRGGGGLLRSAEAGLPGAGCWFHPGTASRHSKHSGHSLGEMEVFLGSSKNARAVFTESHLT